MPTLRLTDKSLRGLTTERPDFEEFWDEGFGGASFGVRVSGTTGERRFVLIYRADGKRRRMTLGRYPDVSLAEARGKARSIVGQVAGGADPVLERKRYEAGDTFRDLWGLFVREEERKLRAATFTEYARQYEVDLEPLWGDLKVAEIKRADVRALLSGIANDREAPVASDRVRSLIHRLFNFALAWDMVEANPCAGLPRRTEPRRRERVLSADEIRAVWGALEPEQEPIASLYRLLLIMGQRSGETRQARWDEIEPGSPRVWTIPPEKAKNGRMHRLPLPPLAEAVLRDLEPLTGFQDFVFYHSRGDGPIANLGAATNRLRKRVGFHFVPHDLRRTVGTHLAEIGTDRLTIAKVLNHKSADNTVTAIYDRYRREPEVEAALMRWSDRLEEILRGPGSAVVGRIA